MVGGNESQGYRNRGAQGKVPPQYFKQLVVVPLQYFQQILGLTKGVPPQYLTPTHGSELEKLADFWCLWHRLHLEKQTFLYIVAKHKWIDKLPDTDRLERPKSKYTNQQTDRQTERVEKSLYTAIPVRNSNLTT